MSNNVWVVYGTTESGDQWLLVFKNEPTEDQIIDQFEVDSWLKEEWETECIQGWDVTKQEVIYG